MLRLATTSNLPKTSRLLKKITRPFSKTKSKDFYDRFKNFKEAKAENQEKKNRNSIFNHLEDEFNLKADFEKMMSQQLPEKMAQTFRAEFPESEAQKEKEEMMDYVREQRKHRISADDLFGSGSKVRDLDRANRILEENYHKVCFWGFLFSLGLGVLYNTHLFIEN